MSTQQLQDRQEEKGGEAVALFQKALRLPPEKRSDQIKLLQKVRKTAESMGPDAPDGFISIYGILGNAYFMKGEYGDATLYYEKGLEMLMRQESASKQNLA